MVTLAPGRPDTPITISITEQNIVGTSQTTGQLFNISATPPNFGYLTAGSIAVAPLQGVATVTLDTGANPDVLNWTYTVDFSDAFWDTLDTGDTSSFTFTIRGSDDTGGGTTGTKTINVNLFGLDEICFTRGTKIRTPFGDAPIERLQKGDEVITKTNGAKKILWIGSSVVTPERRRGNSELEPVALEPGSLGKNLPSETLRISRQHRLLMENYEVEMWFGTEAVLTTAKSLLNGKTIHDCGDDFEELEYFHLMCEDHEVIYANDVPVESLYLGPQALNTMNKKQVDEILKFVPEAFNPDNFVQPCFPVLKNYEAKVLRAELEPA